MMPENTRISKQLILSMTFNKLIFSVLNIFPGKI